MSHTDRIVLRGIRAVGRHGARAGERDRDQPFEIDLEIVADLSTAAGTDDLSDTIDYSAVAAAVRTLVGSESFALLESLADALARRVLQMGGDEVTVRVHKPAAALSAGAHDISVEVRRRSG